MPGNSPYTRSGVRRAGDDYQDIVALDALISMLEHPTRYDWVRVEADEFGSLDDVVVRRMDGVTEAIQVKFSAHPDETDDPYDWDHLTKVGKAKNGADLPSLAQKWGGTVVLLLDDNVKVRAVLETNRRADPSLAATLDSATGRVRADRLPSAVREALVQQLAGEYNVARFLEVFEFRLDQASLDTREASLRRRFGSLGGSDAGWLNLKDRLRAWVRDRTQPAPDGKIRLKDVRYAGQWLMLNPLPQGFEVPTDYVIPSGDRHRDILGLLSQQTGKCVVVTGTPGVGKSTYLSNLSAELRRQGRTTIRHHYFLSLSDTTVGRYDHTRVVESLMADLSRIAAPALTDVASTNPTEDQLPKWLDACSEYYSQKAAPLVIIIDGLDHVWREHRTPSEVSKLFEFLLPCRRGICLVIGTQPLSDECLPTRLLNSVPREDWIDLPPLDRQAVLEWTQKNHSYLPTHFDEHGRRVVDDLNGIATAFYDATHGNPLLLRYFLNELVDRGNPITARAISAPSRFTAGSVPDYYRSLWTSLDEDCRIVLCTIAAVGFEWPESGILECGRANGMPIASAFGSWRRLRYMMCCTALGWQPFHESLNVFVRNTHEFVAASTTVKRGILQWLTSTAPEYWTWAYAWRMEADLGNVVPLLSGTTREWVIDSLTRGYPLSQVCETLAHSARESLSSGDFRGFANRALLLDYTRPETNPTWWQSESARPFVQLRCRFADNLPQVLLSRRRELTDEQLGCLAEALQAANQLDGVRNVVAELSERVASNSRAPSQGDWLSAIAPLVWTEALDTSTNAAGIANRLRRNRGQVDTVRMAGVYAVALAAHRRSELLRQVPDSSLTAAECEVFLFRSMLLAIEEGVDWRNTARLHGGSVTAAVYSGIRRLPEFAAEDDLLSPIRPMPEVASAFDDPTESLGIWVESSFCRLLASHLWDREAAVQQWLRSLPPLSWSTLFARHLASAAKSLASALCEHRQFSLADFYAAFATLTPPDFHARDGSHDLWIACCRHLCGLGLDVAVLAGFGQGPCLDQPCMASVFSSSHCTWNIWVEAYVRRRRAWLDRDAVNWIVASYGQFADMATKELADDGISVASVLACLTALHGDEASTREFMTHATSLTIAYVQRKDLLLHDFMGAISAVRDRSPEFAASCIAPLVPAILHVCDYTDGSETDHVPGLLFDTLAVLRPDWLSSIYLYLSKKEAYRDAEKAFCGILRSLPFATPPEIALGKSCLGARDIAALEQRARQGFSGAVEALAAIQRFVGASPFPVAMSPDSQPSNCTVPLPSLAAPSPMDYAPDRIAAYWNELRANYCGRGEEELRAWADYWRTRESTRVVCDALMRLRESEERSGCSLLIYELVAETQGRDTAYPWLVQAFRETHGWYAHYSSPVTASKMWSVVRGCHPAKRLSFIAETMGAHGPTEPSLHGRFGRLIEYLQLIGRDSDAERVLQGVCDSIQGLVAPYRLPRLDNLTEAASTPVPVLAILLARLTWPSGMVRERSCTALTDLITDPNEQPQTADAILHWIHNQRLESVACLGLLPFVKMKQFRRDAVLPAIGQFRAACARPSIQYECLLGYLFPGEESALSLGHGHSGAIPPDFLPDGIFSEQHARMSRTCSDGVTLLGRAFNVSLLQRWAYETHQASVRGLSEDANASYYWGRRDDEHYVAFDTILSETFRSGYLRTLAWLAETHEGSRASCRTEAIRSLPLDLGLWFADPQPMPKWWPIIATHANDMIDTVPAEVANSVESLWALREADDWVIGMASGRVSEGSATYDLEIFGLFQSCTGPQTPTAESLFETAPWGKGGLRLMPVSAEYQGVVRESSPDDLAVHMDDWQIVPGVRFAPPWPVPRWQWWRAIRSMWAPLPLLSVEGKLNVTCGADRVEFWDGEEPLGIWRDWSLGLSEQQTANLTPRTGQALMLRRSAVDRFAASKGYTFCWAYRVNGFQRKRIGQYDEFGISYVIGATNLILPT